MQVVHEGQLVFLWTTLHCSEGQKDAAQQALRFCEGSSLWKRYNIHSLSLLCRCYDPICQVLICWILPTCPGNRCHCWGAIKGKWNLWDHEDIWPLTHWRSDKFLLLWSHLPVPQNMCAFQHRGFEGLLNFSRSYCQNDKISGSGSNFLEVSHLDRGAKWSVSQKYGSLRKHLWMLQINEC